MSWSWSHTAEAEQNVLGNLKLVSLPKLQVISAEWAAYKTYIERSKKELTDGILADAAEASKDIETRNETRRVKDRMLRDIRQDAEASIKRALFRFIPSYSTSEFDDVAYRATLKELRKHSREYLKTSHGMSEKSNKQYAKNILRDNMAEDMWSDICELATCTNGGWEAWCCPYGCTTHMVSFSSLDERREEALEKARHAKRKTKKWYRITKPIMLGFLTSRDSYDALFQPGETVIACDGTTIWVLGKPPEHVLVESHTMANAIYAWLENGAIQEL